MSGQMKRYIVWVCQGCDWCEPPDGSPRMTGPCTDTSPSMSGAEVVITADLRAAIDALRDDEEMPDSYELGWNHALAAVLVALDATEPTS